MCHVENLKELLAGDTTRVNVKYKSDQLLQGLPIIILTNDNLSIFGLYLRSKHVLNYLDGLLHHSYVIIIKK